MEKIYLSDAGPKVSPAIYGFVRVRRALQETSPKYNADIESIAVAWLIKLGALPLIGTRSEKRIRNIAGAFDIQLDNQDWYELYTASRKENSKQFII